MITDEVVEKACTIYFGSQNWPHDVEEVELVRISMRDALEAVAPMLVPDGWQPIETAPVGTSIFVYHPMKGRYMAYQDAIDDYGNTVWVTWSGVRGDMPPTHWMPLPKPPQ